MSVTIRDLHLEKLSVDTHDEEVCIIGEETEEKYIFVGENYSSDVIVKFMENGRFDPYYFATCIGFHMKQLFNAIDIIKVSEILTYKSKKVKRDLKNIPLFLSHLHRHIGDRQKVIIV